MIAFIGSNSLPLIPPEKVPRILRRLSTWFDEYNAEFAWLQAQGFTFYDWTNEFTEANSTTLQTYYTPEEWQLIFPSPRQRYPEFGENFNVSGYFTTFDTWLFERKTNVETADWFQWYAESLDASGPGLGWILQLSGNYVQQRVAYQCAEILRLTNLGRPAKS